MDTSKRLKAVVVLMFASLAVSGGSWAAVMNGDFETPVVTGAGGYDYRTGAALTGWTLNAPNNGIVHFNATYKPVGGGRQSIQLEYPDDYIEQLIATVIGQNYLLSFDLSAYAPPGTSTLEVEIDNVAVFGSPFAGTDPGYVTFTVPFVASAASTLLHFENGGASTGTYPHLDNISVRAVPEPASLALTGLALAGLSLVRRRKQA